MDTHKEHKMHDHSQHTRQNVDSQSESVTKTNHGEQATIDHSMHKMEDHSTHKTHEGHAMPAMSKADHSTHTGHGTDHSGH